MAPKYKTRADVTIPGNIKDQDRRDKVRTFIHQQIPINLTAWKEEVDTATGLASQPAKPESRLFWFLALAGNLAWAATCLIAPEAAVGAAAAEAAMGESVERFMTQKQVAKQLAGDIARKVAKNKAEDSKAIRSLVTKTMNFGGAAIGSGTLEQLSSKDEKDLGPDDGKDLIRDIIGKSRAKLEADYKGLRDSWTDELLTVWKMTSVEPLDLFDVFVWAKMFPRIPYDDDRFNTIRHNAKDVIESALADYNRQWEKYQRDSMMPHYHTAEALYAMGTLAVQGPFEPKLFFKID